MKVVFIQGGGIGYDQEAAVRQIVAASGVDIDWQVFYAGQAAIERDQPPLSKEMFDAVRQHGTALKTKLLHPAGPVKTNLKQGGERVVRVHAEGQVAISTFTPVRHFRKIASLMSVSIGTGRTHQIRVHAAHAGYPIAGDEKYGDKEKDAKLKEYGL